MTLASVAWNGTRIDASDAGSSTSNIGGGPGAGAEPDLIYQGSGATPQDISRKVGTSSGGFAINTTITNISTATGTYQTCVLKFAAGNWAALETEATPGMQARVGSGTSAYAAYNFAGVDSYPEKGGFIFLCVDPNITGYRTSTSGSPALASADYFGIVGDFTATSKSENMVQSAVDVGDGYTVTGGGGADPTASYADISAFNSTLSNRHGFFFALEGQEGAYGQYGTVIWGSSATAVDYQDTSSPTVFLLDGFYAAGWSGIVDNIENASTVIAPIGGTFISRGNTTTTDTRSVYTVVGSATTASRANQTFKNFASFTGDTNLTYTSLTFENCGQIVQNDGTFTGFSVTGGDAGVAFVCDNDSKISDGTITGADRGISFTGAGPFTLDGVTLTGNTMDIQVNSASDVVVNLLSGSSATTIENIGAGNATIAIPSNILTLTDLGVGWRVRISKKSDNSELLDVVVTGSTASVSIDEGLLVTVRIISLSQVVPEFDFTMPGNDISIQPFKSQDRNYANN